MWGQRGNPGVVRANGHQGQKRAPPLPAGILTQLKGELGKHTQATTHSLLLLACMGRALDPPHLHSWASWDPEAKLCGPDQIPLGEILSFSVHSAHLAPYNPPLLSIILFKNSTEKKAKAHCITKAQTVESRRGRETHQPGWPQNLAEGPWKIQDTGRQGPRSGRPHETWFLILLLLLPSCVT
jgi:hypothetical protein